MWYSTGNLLLFTTLLFSLPQKVLRKPNPLTDSELIYISLVTTFFIVAKIDFLACDMINLDEAVFLAGARTLISEPFPWLSVDSTTSGPINFLIPALLLRVFENTSYGSVRLVYYVLCQLGSILVLYFTFRKIAGKSIARLLIIPLIVVFSCAFHPDFTHASSEQIIILLFSIILSLILIQASVIKLCAWQYALSGLICALAFYVKIQSAPIFYVAFVLFLVSDLRNSHSITLLLTGFIGCNVIFIAWILWRGSLGDFLTSYIWGNLNYTGTSSFNQDAFENFISLTFESFLPILICYLFFILIAIYKLVSRNRAKQNQSAVKPFSAARIPKQAIIAQIILLAVSLYCVTKPNRYFIHYAWLLLPVLYTLSVCYILNLNILNRVNPFHILFTILFLGVLYRHFTKTSALYFPNYQQHSEYSQNDMIDDLREESKKGDRLAVWGWGSHYNHAAGLLMGTRDGHFEFQVKESKMKAYYQKRFISDLVKNKPRWFLDTSDMTINPIEQSFCLQYSPDIYQLVMRNYDIFRSYKYGTLYRLR